MLSVILGEVLLMITYNICFNGELEKTNAMEHNLQECMDLVYSFSTRHDDCLNLFI